MYYLVNVDHNDMMEHLTRSYYEGFFRSALCPLQWRLIIICCGMIAKMMGMLGVNVRKTVKIGESDIDW